jgi:EAL domain-containing protein (putative c-di-GMP-specific phosphodiesterase class I)
LTENAQRHAASGDRLDALLDALPMGIMVVDTAGTVIVRNMAARDLAPPARIGEAVPFAALIDLRSDARQHVRLASPGGAVDVDVRPLVWDGEPAYVVCFQRARGDQGHRGDAPLATMFRPIIDLSSTRTAGFLVEATGGGDLDDDARLQRVIARATSALAEWATDAVNADPPHLALEAPSVAALQPGLAAFIDAVARRAGTPTRRFWIRVAESLVAADPSGAQRGLGELRAVGVRVALDRFGSGSSSLEVLRGLPLDGVIIDAELVRRGDWAVVQTVVSVARHLGVTVSAAGVDDPSAMARLRALGCRFGEGAAFGAAMEARRAFGVLAAPRGGGAGEAHGAADPPS